MEITIKITEDEEACKEAFQKIKEYLGKTENDTWQDILKTGINKYLEIIYWQAFRNERR